VKREDRLIKLVPRAESLFHQILDLLPPGTASLEIRPLKNSRHGGSDVRLKPVNPLSARISVDVEYGDPNVYMWVGKAPSLEMWVERESDVIEGIRKGALAVIKGDFEEEIWSVGEKLVKCVGRLTVGGEVHTLRRFGGFYPFRTKSTEL
jgi:hypothetical protein